MRGRKPLTCYMTVKEIILKATNQALANNDQMFLLQINQQQEHYEIIVDGDVLLGINQITELSRSINKLLEEPLADNTEYSIDVTTAGADSPLLLLRQYPKHIGRNFKIKTTDDNEFEGKLISLNNETLAFEIAPDKKKKIKSIENKTIQFNQIKKANIIISFK